MPKGTSFNKLTQDDIDILMSNINSYGRKKLNDKSPYEVFSALYGETTLDKLNIKKMESNQINLTPTLLKKR